MAKLVLVATSSAQEGRDDDYNAWYDEVHLADVCAIPGVISGRRFTASPASPYPVPASYLAIYEIETDDPAGVMAELRSRAASGQMKMTDSLDRASTQLWLWEERS